MEKVTVVEMAYNYFSYWDLFLSQSFFIIICLLLLTIIFTASLLKFIQAALLFYKQKRGIETFENEFWSGVSLDELTKLQDSKKTLNLKQTFIEEVFIAGMNEIARHRSSPKRRETFPNGWHMQTALKVRIQALFFDYSWQISKYSTAIFMILVCVTGMSGIEFLEHMERSENVRQIDNLVLSFPVVFGTLIYLVNSILASLQRGFYLELEERLITFSEEFSLIVERNREEFPEDE